MVDVTLSTTLPPGAECWERADSLLGNRRLVGGEVLGELDELSTDKVADAADQDESQHHGDQGRDDPGQLIRPQRMHDRGKGEAQENRKGEGNEDVAAEIEGADREHDAAGREVGRRPGRRRGDRGRGRRSRDRPWGHAFS